LSIHHDTLLAIIQVPTMRAREKELDAVAFAGGAAQQG
jgi:hypothetical protein